mmetsp:Transcript_11091/g.24450  ORF Transcript_11091/g.24450 Transcript_11091/m.24450 type:complete len:252 (-) Transcript_11091:722-1477(-)
MDSVATSIADSLSAARRSRAFLLSSPWSSCRLQYSFLCSSSFCSSFKTLTISSIILITFSKPCCELPRFPWRATEMRSSATLSCLFADRMAVRTTLRARFLALLFWNWIKLAEVGLGKVFLNKSKASSSLRTLMVSAKATNSSDRVFERSSHSDVFVSQLVSSSERYFLSAMSAASVSDRSSFIWTIETPSSPIWPVFASISALSALTSFCLAAIVSSYALMAADSVLVRSANDFFISSPISFRMPVTSPD